MTHRSSGLQAALRGQSTVLAPIVLFGFLLLLLGVMQVYLVPQAVTSAEHDHHAQLQEEFTSLAAATSEVALDGEPHAVTVQTGVNYDPKFLLRVPGGVTGQMSVERLGTVAVDNVSVVGTGGPASEEFGPYDTSGVAFSPQYRNYRNAGTVRFENGVVVSAVADGPTTITSGRSFVDGTQLTLITVDGSIPSRASYSQTLSLVPTSSAERSVVVKNTSGQPITVRLPTALSNESWTTVLESEYATNGGHIVGQRVTGGELVVTLERDVEYQLRLARVTLGEPGAPRDEPAVDIVTIAGSDRLVPPGGSQRLIVEARDRYLNPVSGVTVRADATAADGSIRSMSRFTGGTDLAVTDEHGQASFLLTANPDAVANTSNVTFSIVPTDGDPVATFTPTCTDLSCSFDASGSADDGSIASYEWTFGDTTTDTGVNPSHTYGGDGSYTVTLTVTDDEGNTDTATRTVTVAAAGAGTPPSVSGVTVTSLESAPTSSPPADGRPFDVSVSFDSDEQLGGVSVILDGPEDSASYDLADFEETDNGDGTFTYTLRTDSRVDDRPFQASADGEYTATVTDATDLAGTTNTASVSGSATFDYYGVYYEYYEADDEFTSLDDVPWESSTDTGTRALPAEDRGHDDDEFAYRYTAYLYVPEDSTYEFQTRSDDGSRLYIDGQEVVDNAGLHGPANEQGTEYLTAGWHELTVTFFEHTGGDVLEVSWDGTGGRLSTIEETYLVPRLPDDDTPPETTQALMSNGDAEALNGPGGSNSRAGLRFSVTNGFDQQLEIIGVVVAPHDSSIVEIDDPSYGEGAAWQSELFIESDNRDGWVDISNGGPIPGASLYDRGSDTLSRQTALVGAGEQATMYLFEFKNDHRAVNMNNQPVDITLHYRLDDGTTGSTTFTVNGVGMGS